jgi:hypothetical protein
MFSLTAVSRRKIIPVSKKLKDLWRVKKIYQHPEGWKVNLNRLPIITANGKKLVVFDNQQNWMEMVCLVRTEKTCC